MVTVTYHPVCGSTYLRLAWVTRCGKVCAAGCAWCLRRAVLLRGFRLFGVALHREAKAHKRAIEPHYMRPVILHGFGTSAKKRMPNSLADLAQFGWLPLAAALFGTHEWKPQWLHQQFPSSGWTAAACQSATSLLSPKPNSHVHRCSKQLS